MAEPWGKVKGATAPYDIERAMRALEPILVGLHERPGGASPHMGTFGLERMAAEMARYVAAGEMRIEHMVDLINILFAEISRLACLKRERRDMPDIDFAAITEVVASEDLEAKLSKVRLDKAAAESARHELSKRSRPGLSGVGGGDDGDGEPGDTPPLSKTAKKKAAKAAGKAKVSFADQADAAAKATVAKEAKETKAIKDRAKRDAAALLDDLSLGDPSTADDVAAMTALVGQASDGSITEIVNGTGSLVVTYDKLQEAAGRRGTDVACAWRDMMGTCSKADLGTCLKCKNEVRPPAGLRDMLRPKASQRIQLLIPA